jgi:uncharacterized protein (TIGR02145 family)
MKTLAFKVLKAAIIIILLSRVCYSQTNTLSLTFTAAENTQYIQLENIRILNLDKECDTMLYWNDTVLVLDYGVGIHEAESSSKGFELGQLHPNPVIEQSRFNVYVLQQGEISFLITDTRGREHLAQKQFLDQGDHLFSLTPGGEKLYFLTAYYKGNSRSIKIMNAGLRSGDECKISYIGSTERATEEKSLENITAFKFSPGDELLCIGSFDGMESGLTKLLYESDTCIFQFAQNIYCPGIPTVSYEGQVYNTIQIMGQCWLKENLNVGVMIPGPQDMEDDGIIEKYCYQNLESNCDDYGGLYLMEEMMQYIFIPGTRGICPPGWHIPTDAEWKVLEGVVDSFYGIGDPEWDNYLAFRGLDAGKNLKSLSSWNSGGNGTDLYGFTALPTGYRTAIGAFDYEGENAYFWSSSDFKIKSQILHNHSVSQSLSHLVYSPAAETDIE